MGLKEEAADEVGRQQKCGFYVLVKEMDKDEWEELEECVRDPLVSPKGLQRALKKRGIDLPEWQIRRHRKGECKRCQ